MGRLEETFGELPVWLAAENGVYVHPPKGHQDLPQVGCVRSKNRAGGASFSTLLASWVTTAYLVKRPVKLLRVHRPVCEAVVPPPRGWTAACMVLEIIRSCTLW